MTDHIGEATKKVIDLDALEKLAADLRVSWSERGWVASKKIDGLLKEARQASDGLTALIAELKEARAALEPFSEGARMAEISGRPPSEFCDASDYQTARAFLARNGKGEG